LPLRAARTARIATAASSAIETMSIAMSLR
jgi:hypothetical protein